ncbi:hypothetical protein BDY24DRAFT_236836 [Mrakia frigida]|uniref:uncharacterized protein n=1 Tax=Mrakia frigida TaxID=29902 RepID=UPI003FCC09CC
MRVMLLGEEGGERQGEGQGHAEMDVEVEEIAVEAQKESECCFGFHSQVEAVPQVEPAAVVERSEDAPMNSDDPFADHNSNSHFVLVDPTASSEEERNRREPSSTPFDDEPRPATASNTHEDPPTAMLVDDTEPSLPQAPDPDVAEDQHVVDADDPEEIFPPSSSTAAEPQPQPQQAQPSLLNDLSQLLTSITSSEALATILARAAQGAYAPTLPNVLHSSSSSIPEQVKSQIEHVRDQLTNGLGDAESVVAGLAKAFQDGLKQVEEVRKERLEKERGESESREGGEKEEEEEEGRGGGDRGEKKGREEREEARQVRERARELAQKEREQRKKAEEARRNTLQANPITTSTFGFNYAESASPARPRPPTAPALHVPTAPRDAAYSNFGPPRPPMNMFSPPSGPPPPPTPPSSSLFSSFVPPTRPPHQHYHHQPHLHPHPQHRHTWGAPGFPGGGMFGGGGTGTGAGAIDDARVRTVGSKLNEMGFKESDYRKVLKRVLGEQGGEWRTDEEVVIEVVRELVMGGK